MLVYLHSSRHLGNEDGDQFDSLINMMNWSNQSYFNSYNTWRNHNETVNWKWREH